MSQDFSTPVSGVTKFGELYAVITNALNSVRSCFAGAAFPASPVQGQACFRTDTLRFYIYSGSTWVDLTDYLPAFKAIKSEVASARGSAATLEARLDVAINNDGTLKGDAPASSWWTDEADTVVYVDASSFTVAGDKTAIYTVNRAISLEQTTDTVGRLTGALYDDGSDLTTVTVDCAVDDGLTGVAYGQPVDNYPAHAHAAGDLPSSPPAHTHGASDLTSLPDHTHGGADLTDLTGWLGGTTLGALGGLSAHADHFHGIAVFVDVKGQNVYGGAGTAGTWMTRDLNTQVFNAISGCSLSSNRITLPPGAYFLMGLAPSYVADYTCARFYNYTTGAYVGHNGPNQRSYTGSGDLQYSWAFAWQNLSASYQYELRHYFTRTTSATGMGAGPSSFTVNYYSTVIIFKLGER
jgi:hypothetical protein